MASELFRQTAQDHEKSKFDSGLAVIYRIDDLHKGLHSAHLNMNIDAIYRLLISLFKEVGRKLKESELKRHFRYWDDVKRDYFKILKLKRQRTRVPDELLDSFHWWELQLTLAEEKYNLGMPSQGGARYALK